MRQPLFLVCLWMISFSRPALAEFSEEEPVHHFFNARLLNKNETQISIVGNLRYGVSDNFEIGTQGLLFLGQIPNISAKHRMFKRPDFETSFTGHLLYFPQSVEDQTTSNNADRTDSEEKEKTKSSMLVFPYGIVTTANLSDQGALTLGLLDFYIYNRSSDYNTKANFHIFTPVVAYDLVINANWAASAILAYPVYIWGELESDVVEAELAFDMLNGVPSDMRVNMGFLTMTWSQGNFNIEFGGMMLMNQIMPYANLFWRWK